ncbi:oxidoreductase [Actinoplanes sp. TRM 88003]|uniref:Oxidoreductase n=1 Tax=Paractinoplanes aksuensis TaxID=2939490 RepID=A0ABT1DJ12_9ACTN|nr:oxidoreductase [Actinoplanes aksuensis]MCO8270819.1 oxidoreductase [Actinoplanes aksuensis]
MTTNLHGRVAVVTGANSGLGRVTATELSRAGAHVILAVRNVEAGQEAARAIGGDVEARELDLASLASVRAFAAGLPTLDLLVNNAGAVLLGPRRETSDGFELHLGTNMLGHFALTGLALPNLAPTARVVNLSSITHKRARLDFDDLMFRRNYSASKAYGVSKLACTVFGLELDRRLRATGSSITAVLAHPGITRTNLTPRAWEHRGRLGRFVASAALITTQSVERGTEPQLRAATDPDLRGGEFLGPSGLFEMRGPVTKVRPSAVAADPAVGRRLWAVAEELTGVSYL